jgi:hypothetical protein
MQRLHRFLGGRLRVVPMNLQEIQVWRAETLERGIDGVEDGGTGEAKLVNVFERVTEVRHEHGKDRGIIPNYATDFAEYENLLAGDIVLHIQLGVRHHQKAMIGNDLFEEFANDPF